MKKRHTSQQIVAKLRQADVLIGKGKSIPEVCREIEVSEQTYYRWRQKYGGMNPEMIKELRELQKENARLKKVVADQDLAPKFSRRPSVFQKSSKPGLSPTIDCRDR